MVSEKKNNYGASNRHNGDDTNMTSPSTEVKFKFQAQAAHSSLDVESSRLIHDQKSNRSGGNAGVPTKCSTEAHLEGGDHIKSAVYGGLDGIITTFATVTSVYGSGLNHSVILILGLAHLVADGMSMGLGDALSTQAEQDLAKHERKREVWEFENYPEGEIEEMIELYEQKGITTKDATLVIETLAKYKEAFVDIMMVEELNIMPTDMDSSPFTGGVITFCSFMLFGMVPLLPYLVNLIPAIQMGSAVVFDLSCFFTVMTLFALGAIKGRYVGQSFWMAGFSMALNGSLAASAGWVIGFLLQLTGIQNVV